MAPGSGGVFHPGFPNAPPIGGPGFSGFLNAPSISGPGKTIDKCSLLFFVFFKKNKLKFYHVCITIKNKNLHRGRPKLYRSTFKHYNNFDIKCSHF